MMWTIEDDDEILSEWTTELLNGWEIRLIVLLSLVLQIILVRYGSRRKYTAGTCITVLVWSAYLSADWVATVALGNLARSQSYYKKLPDKPNNVLLAFWAPFLLLHLGGPDTITAFSIQDNELWLRHFLGLLFQVVVALYVLVTSWSSCNITFLAIPMFVSGIIKYGERTFALKSSTPGNIKGILRSVPPQGHEKQHGMMKVVPRRNVSQLISNNLLHQAYYLFRMSIFLFEDLILGFSELNDSYLIVSVKTAKEAFEVIEVELGFIYDLFYTKAIVVYSNAGMILRLISFMSIIAVFFCFTFLFRKQGVPPVDVAITYILLAGAIVLEVYAFVHLTFSDWSMVWYFTDEEGKSSNRVFGWIYKLHTRWSEGRRWSRCFAQLNLISSGLKINPPQWLKHLYVEDMLKHYYTNRVKVDDEMKMLIFEHLLKKGKEIKDHLSTDLLHNLISRKGSAILQQMEHSDELLKIIRDLDFSHRLLILHIATDLCYYDELSEVKDATCLSPECRTSKCLSDYMFYLLAMKPSMLPKGIVDYKDSRYLHACEEVTVFLSARTNINEMEVCLKVLNMDLGQLRCLIAKSLPQQRVLGSKRREYHLVDGCKFAKILQKEEGERKWRLINEVWIEMLAYAASHCEWKEHAQELRRGGELLTHVCLLMAHLGLSHQYQEASIEEDIEIKGQNQSLEV